MQSLIGGSLESSAVAEAFDLEALLPERGAGLTTAFCVVGVARAPLRDLIEWVYKGGREDACDGRC